MNPSDERGFGSKDEFLADEAARKLAELLGTSVAGKIPSGAELDLDVELHIRNNMSIASMCVLAALTGADDEMRSLVLRRIRSDHFREKTIEAYLFDRLSRRLEAQDQISRDEIFEDLAAYGPSVWDERTDRGTVYKVNQILSLDPSIDQLTRAIELLELRASEKT